MKRDLSAFSLAAGLLAFGVGVAPAQSEAADPNPEFVSILDVAPQTLRGFIRMPKFYGDENMNRETVDGSLLERQYLLGSLGGLRTRAAESGLFVDAGVTQVYQGVVSGDGDNGKYAGSGDIWAALDTGRAGLWSGGLFIAHFEGNWGELVSGTGALLPLNADATMPTSPDSLALSELYLFQALPEGFGIIAGKLDWAGTADTSLFANNERTQFLYEGFVNNAVLGAFVPYTSTGIALTKEFQSDLSLSAGFFSNDSNATTSSLDDFAFDKMTYFVTGGWTPTFSGLPGNYNFIVGYSSKDIASFDVDDEYLIGEIIGTVPVAEESGNYALTLTGSQYVWINEGATRSDGQAVGFGPFFRFGIAPKDRNLIDQFYSVGIGGTGGPFGRNDDNWGIGWAGTHISSDFRRDADELGVSVDDFEHAVEGYYNVALTPAMHASFHAQYVNSANPSADDAVVLSTRLQLDF